MPSVACGVHPYRLSNAALRWLTNDVAVMNFPSWKGNSGPGLSSRRAKYASRAATGQSSLFVLCLCTIFPDCLMVSETICGATRLSANMSLKHTSALLGTGSWLVCVGMVISSSPSLRNPKNAVYNAAHNMMVSCSYCLGSHKVLIWLRIVGVMGSLEVLRWGMSAKDLDAPL